ncbi:hypothetical protein CFP56_035643 [Quercus suber]|uniref:Uncharacterized protein n=1 Tax=Quercus suber TaxID=58331 RepID=A0AAW0JA82_QUESU
MNRLKSYRKNGHDLLFFVGPGNKALRNVLKLHNSFNQKKTAITYFKNQLTKSLGILKQVPIVLGRQGIEKYKNSYGKLNTLIKLTLVTGCR